MIVYLVDSLKCGICKFNRPVSLVLMLFSLIFSGASNSASLSDEQYKTLTGILNTHLNYFMSTAAVTSYGLPLSAYKVGDRARYGYSNPAEWGYLLQAFIVAARNKITKAEAASRIATTLNTVKTLQDNNLQVYNGGLFYPYYKVTDSSGNDVFPYHDSSQSIPSMDNSVLYMSLVIVDGWALDNNFTSLSNQARAIYSKMNFSPFIYTESSTGKKIEALVVNASTNALAGKCDVYANEGGLTTMIAYFSGSVDFATYNALTSAQLRGPATWNGITVKEADWFNPMFTWGVRSLAGVPVTGTPYSTASLVPSYKAHLTYEQIFGIDYPALSDAMSQGWVQNYFLPNISGQYSTVTNSVPHAFFIPLNVLPDLDQATLDTTFTKINAMMGDKAGYYYGTGWAYPFGFVVATSPRKDDTAYLGVVPIDGKNIFETLSEAFIALSAFNALQQQDNSKDFAYFMMKTPNMVDYMKSVLAYLYPTYNPTLTVKNPNTVGGTVTSDSGGINCGTTCSQSYAIGTSVTLTATPASGYSFTGWSDNCESSEPPANPLWSCKLTLLTATNATANFKANSLLRTDSLVFDFNPYGLWLRHSSGAWKQLHTLPTSQLVAADLDGNGVSDLVVDFNPYWLWKWMNRKDWEYLHNLPAKVIAAADLDGNGKADLAIDFAPYGIWKWMNNQDWVKLLDLSSKSVTAALLDENNRRDLVIDLAPYGLWQWMNDQAWAFLPPPSPPPSTVAISPTANTTGDLDGNGHDDVVSSFGPSSGLWAYLNNQSWVKLHDLSPLALVAADLDGNGKTDVAINFGQGTGLWAWMNNQTWVQLHVLAPSAMAAAYLDANPQQDLVVDFAPNGIWTFKNNQAWEKLHDLPAKHIVAMPE